jgi:hypothetical protein
VLNQKTTPSLGVRLLADLRSVFTTAGTDRMHSAEIVARLRAIEDAPWTDLNGKPLDSRRLAQELNPYQVAPLTFKHNGTNAKGYVTHATVKQVEQVGLADAWARYLPALTSCAETSEGEK